MSIEINLDGEVRILSPLNIKTKSILEVVENKGNWICKKQDELKVRRTHRKSNKYINGEIYSYLGNDYMLTLNIDETLKKPKVILSDNMMKITYKELNPEIIKNILEMWYREKTLEVVQQRVHIYNKFFSTSPKELKVKQQKTRWASCTYDNRILFNWRISMAPIEVIDYIVVHEMCHMDFKDHSSNYWRRVKSIMPNYEIYKIWLKENGLKLDI